MTNLAAVLKSVPPHELDAVVYGDQIIEGHLSGCKRCLVEKVLAAVIALDAEITDNWAAHHYFEAKLTELAHEAGLLTE